MAGTVRWITGGAVVMGLTASASEVRGGVVRAAPCNAACQGPEAQPIPFGASPGPLLAWGQGQRFGQTRDLKIDMPCDVMRV